MKIDLQSIKRSLSPVLITKALQTFDRATMVVVLACWGGALTLTGVALYTLHLSIVAKREVVAASAHEPGLPKIASKPLDSAEIQPVVDRLKKLYSEIQFSMSRDRSLTVTASDVAHFRTWLTVLSYIDTITPQYRWTMKEFCVGSRCERGVSMKAVLGAEKVTFVAPEPAK